MHSLNYIYFREEYIYMFKTSVVKLLVFRIAGVSEVDAASISVKIIVLVLS